jgi:hypothetical protein
MPKRAPLVFEYADRPFGGTLLLRPHPDVTDPKELTDWLRRKVNEMKWRYDQATDPSPYQTGSDDDRMWWKFGLTADELMNAGVRTYVRHRLDGRDSAWRGWPVEFVPASETVSIVISNLDDWIKFRYVAPFRPTPEVRRGLRFWSDDLDIKFELWSLRVHTPAVSPGVSIQYLKDYLDFVIQVYYVSDSGRLVTVNFVDGG